MIPNPPSSAPPVTLIGHTGAGKSTIGAELARLLGWSFVDSDHLIMSRHGNIRHIFASQGEETFRRYEADVIKNIIGTTPNPYVLSVGGGAAMNAETQRLFRQTIVVWLKTDLTTVLPRLLRDSGRPLLTEDVGAQWQYYHDARKPVYQALADITLDVRAGTAASLASELMKILQKNNFDRPQ